MDVFMSLTRLLVIVEGHLSQIVIEAFIGN